MEFKRACYSRSKVNQAIAMADKINETVKRKNEYFAKNKELEAAYKYAEENVNNWVFDADFDLKKYRQMSYNYKNYKGVELQRELNYCKRHLINELHAIKAAIESRQVDVID